MNEKSPGGSRRLGGRPLVRSWDGCVTSALEIWFSEKRSHSGGTEGESGVTPGSVQGPWVRKTHSHQGSLRDMEEQRHWWDHGTPPQKPRGDSVIMGDGS